jgi:hypothetical protein
VYGRIHDLFEREGIEFASRDVRIRMDREIAADREVARAAATAAELADATSPDAPAPRAGAEPDNGR